MSAASAPFPQRSKHRYAMVLHTDEPHPHVHMVVKAVSEEGVRLNIQKARTPAGIENRSLCTSFGGLLTPRALTLAALRSFSRSRSQSSIRDFPTPLPFSGVPSSVSMGRSRPGLCS